MVFDNDRYEALRQEISEFRIANPQSPNEMPDDKFDVFWKLINEQNSFNRLIVDKPRTNG